MSIYGDMERIGADGPLTDDEEHAEKMRRKAIFSHNLEKIQRHNKRWLQWI